LERNSNPQKWGSTKVKPIVAKPKATNEEYFKTEFDFKVAYQNIKSELDF
jgi:hypothetical protein